MRNKLYSVLVSTYSVRESAALLGVSDDTVRRWAEAGRFALKTNNSGRHVIDGPSLAAFAHEHAGDADGLSAGSTQSARNRFTGLVTRVVKDAVMAQVEIQAGPFRVVSLMSREAADELGLAPGVLAVAGVKATNVVIEVPVHTP